MRNGRAKTMILLQLSKIMINGKSCDVVEATTFVRKQIDSGAS